MVRPGMTAMAQVVASDAADLTAPTPPTPQSLASSATTASLTWTHPGAPSGTTYAITSIKDVQNNSVSTSSGSGLGAWVFPVESSKTYAATIEATGPDGQKAQSTAIVQVASALGEWELLGECDFTDADWTALSSTDATTSTTAWQHVLYEADGATPRAYILNNSAAARTLSIDPSGSGLELVNGSASVQPTIGVWPANWTPLLGGSRADLWMIEAVCEFEEPAGSGALVHFVGVGTGSSAIASPSTGVRVTNTSSNLLVSAASYFSGFSTQTLATVTAGASRLARVAMQVVIGDSRRQTGYFTLGATDFQDPEASAADRIRFASASTTISAVDADDPASSDWFNSGILGRTKALLYHDGTATSGSAVRLKKLRLLRIVGGSH